MPTVSNQPIDFMRYRYWYFLLSALIIIPGLISLYRYGLKPSIDFTGGSLLEFNQSQLDGLSDADLQALLPSEISLGSIQKTSQNTVVLRTSEMNKDQSLYYRLALASAAASLKAATPSGQILPPIAEVRFETLGPTLGQELIKKTILAVMLAAVAITFYVAYRFKNLKYGISAILAMFHDSLILLSVFSLLGFYAGIEVDTLFVTGMLTILSFSVHDTIVVYDRIRESQRQHRDARFYDLVNKAITETMSRSVNNSMTIIFMLLALWLFGGVTIKWFVFTLLIGTISGTYSSPFIAAPLLIEWDRLAAKISRRRNKKPLPGRL